MLDCHYMQIMLAYNIYEVSISTFASKVVDDNMFKMGFIQVVNMNHI